MVKLHISKVENSDSVIISDEGNQVIASLSLDEMNDMFEEYAMILVKYGIPFGMCFTKTEVKKFFKVMKGIGFH